MKEERKKVKKATPPPDMFKKPFHIKTRSPLKGSERKALIDKLLQQFPALSTIPAQHINLDPLSAEKKTPKASSEEPSENPNNNKEGVDGSDPPSATPAVPSLIDLLLPKKSGVEVWKIQTHGESLMKVYLAHGRPMFVEDDGIFFPALYALRMAPDAFMWIYTNHYVLEKLKDGADLMLPGVTYRKTAREETFKVGDLRVVKLKGGAGTFAQVGGAPVAIGRMLVAATDAAKMEARGRDEIKGKALSVHHVLDDYLWTAGDQKDPEVFYLLTPEPKVGADGDSGAPISKEGEGSGGDDDQEVPNDDDDDDDDKEEEEEEEEEEEFDEFAGLDSDDDKPQAKGRRKPAASAQKGKGKATKAEGEARAQSSAAAKSPQDASNSDEEGEGNDADAKEAGVTEEKMDELLEHAFVQALRESVKDSDLPLLASTLYSAHMQDLKPNGIAVDVKKSSHKKFAKFLKAMEKKGYTKTKEIKGIQSIMTIDRQSPALVQFQVTWFAKNAPKVPTPDGSKPAAPAASSSSASGSSSSVVGITELYQPKSALALIFQEQGKDLRGYYTKSELATIMTAYVQSHQLVVKTDPKHATLDAFLTDNLFARNERTRVTKATREELVRRLAGAMTTFHRLQVPGQDPIIRKGEPRPIKVVVKKVGGNKSVTHVTGLEGFLIDPEDFAKKMQKALACSTSVAPAQNVKEGIQVTIQGEPNDRLYTYFVEERLIPDRYLEGVKKPKSK